ncbi:MAG: caspase family protein [Sphingobacteriaceae bacterium]|nr:caspase family protein [Sphingobacteriaceae bacterium]
MIGMMGGVNNVSTSHKYNINILDLNVAQLYQYISNLDQLQKVETKPKNDISAKNTKRNSEEEEDSKDIYASNVDFDKPGKFYAIIIGASNYTDPGIPDLDSLPIKDAMALKKVLSQKYIFDKENIKALYNPTRRDIVIAFAEMSKKITSEDNLLIFYAGHGHYEKESDLGYWLPVDAEVGNPSNWLYNDQLVADVKKIKSLHTLLISDACFSGSIFKTRSVNMQEASSFIKQKYSLPSRKAITSGTLKTVPNKSVFLKYLIDRLTNNKEAFFTASQLFQSLEQPVSNNSKSLPQFGVIQNVGDEGGDFIFIKR